MYVGASLCDYCAVLKFRRSLSATLGLKEEHLLLDCCNVCQNPCPGATADLSCRLNSPTGSYLSMLRGRWVRGRRKVMKKPVRAIDMRRTATVLDFAACVVNISSTPAILRERTFLRHCVMLNECPGYKVRPPVLVGWVNVWLRSEAEVCGALPFWDTLLQTFLLKHSIPSTHLCETNTFSVRYLRDVTILDIRA